MGCDVVVLIFFVVMIIGAIASGSQPAKPPEQVQHHPAPPPVATNPGTRIKIVSTRTPARPNPPSPPAPTPGPARTTPGGVKVATGVKKCKACMSELNDGRRLRKCTGPEKHEVHADCANMCGGRCPECQRPLA